MFTIKAKFGTEIRRLSMTESPSFAQLELAIRNLFGLQDKQFDIKYTDEEGDSVNLSSQSELDTVLLTLPKDGLLRITIVAKCSTQEKQPKCEKSVMNDFSCGKAGMPSGKPSCGGCCGNTCDGLGAQCGATPQFTPFGFGAGNPLQFLSNVSPGLVQKLLPLLRSIVASTDGVSPAVIDELATLLSQEGEHLFPGVAPCQCSGSQCDPAIRKQLITERINQTVTSPMFRMFLPVIISMLEKTDQQDSNVFGSVPQQNPQTSGTRTTQEQEMLNALAAMGFSNDELILPLLRTHNYNMDTVVQTLLGR